MPETADSQRSHIHPDEPAYQNEEKVLAHLQLASWIQKKSARRILRRAADKYKIFLTLLLGYNT